MRNTAAPTAKTGLPTRFTASRMGHTKPKLEMNVPQKPQVFIKHILVYLVRKLFIALVLLQSAYKL